MLKYTGIANPHKIGAYGTARNAAILQRYRFIHESLMRVAAGKLPATEDWDLKLGLSRHVYENAEATDLLRKRIPQLRTSAALLNKDPDPALTLLMDELIHANNDLELATGIYDVIKPALFASYREHLSVTQQIVDQPTIRMLNCILADLEQQLKWGKEMTDCLRDSGIYPDQASEFKQKMLSYLEAAGGINGTGDKPLELPHRWRSGSSYSIPLKSVRDPRKMGSTTLKRSGVEHPPADPKQARLVAMMRTRQEEMSVVELVAGVLYSQKNMPWEFYYDLARHQWDEARHAMFGQAALEADGYEWMSRPQYTLDYDMTVEKVPGAVYSWLSIAIEDASMSNHGKKKEYEFVRDEAKHPLMEQFQDYDWADEVVHAGMGRRWAPEIYGEDLAMVRKRAAREMEIVLNAANKLIEAEDREQQH